MSPGTAKAGEKQLKMNASPLLLAVPASCDFCGSTLMFIALTMVPASVYQMMRGIITVITALLSIIFLKRKQYRHHWVGIACIIIGVAEVGYIAIVYDEGEAGGSNIVLGIILLLVSQLFTGCMFIVEEYFIGDYYLDPMKVVGLEGMWGVFYYIALLPFM
jgi:drug/metabolite transporter (DMT)-like permease